MAFYERRLPHWHPPGKDIFITWRLHGTLSSNRFVPPEGLTSGQAFVCIDRYLDKATYGPAWLGRPEIAQMIVDAVVKADRELRHYTLHAYVVMPNHVHMRITPIDPVPRIMHSLKGFTARAANRALDRTGLPFWQRESYVHWVREGGFDRIKRYIELNPVRAGLAREGREFRWSSACLVEAGRETGLPAGLPAPR